MKFYILIEVCCRHFEGVFISPQEIAAHFEIKENKEWTLDELRNHAWLSGYSIYEYDTEELGKEVSEEYKPEYKLSDLVAKYNNNK